MPFACQPARVISRYRLLVAEEARLQKQSADVRWSGLDRVFPVYQCREVVIDAR
jgi:hypothetical protein